MTDLKKTRGPASLPSRCPWPDDVATRQAADFEQMARGSFDRFRRDDLRDETQHVPIPIIGLPINSLWRHTSGEIDREEIARKHIEEFLHRHGLLPCNKGVSIGELHDPDRPAAHLYRMLKSIVKTEKDKKYVEARVRDTFSMLDTLIAHNLIRLPRDLLYTGRGERSAVEFLEVIQIKISNYGTDNAQERSEVSSFMAKFFGFAARTGIDFFTGKSFELHGFYDLIHMARNCNTSDLMYFLERARASGALSTMRDFKATGFGSEINAISYIDVHIGKFLGKTREAQLKTAARDLGWRPSNTEAGDRSEGSVLWWLERYRRMFIEAGLFNGRFHDDPVEELQKFLEQLKKTGWIGDISELKGTAANSKAALVERFLRRYGNDASNAADTLYRHHFSLEEAVSTLKGSAGWTTYQIWKKAWDTVQPLDTRDTSAIAAYWSPRVHAYRILDSMFSSSTIGRGNLDDLRSDREGTIGSTFMKMVQMRGLSSPIVLMQLETFKARGTNLREALMGELGAALVRFAVEMGPSGLERLHNLMRNLSHADLINTPQDLIALSQVSHELAGYVKELDGISLGGDIRRHLTAVNMDNVKLVENVSELGVFLSAFCSAKRGRVDALIAVIEAKTGRNPLKIKNPEDIRISWLWADLFSRVGARESYVNAINIDELVEKHRGGREVDIDLTSKTLDKIDPELGKRFRKFIQLTSS